MKPVQFTTRIKNKQRAFMAQPPMKKLKNYLKRESKWKYFLG